MRRLRVLGAGLALGVAIALVAAPALAQDGGEGGETTTWLIVIGAIAAALAAFLLMIILFGGRTRRKEARVEARLASYGGGETEEGGLFSRFRLLRKAARSAEGVARDRGSLQMIETALEQANLPLKPGEAIVGAIGLSLILALVIGALTQSFIWAAVAGGGMLFGAVASVNVVASRERKRFENQLPDTLNLISTSLRAGYSLLQAVEAVGQEAAEPTGREFGRALTEIRLGRPVIEALSEIAERMESQDFEWTVLAISIQREVGGNLAEVLQTTAETMLQRNRLRREMRALTAEGRISAIVMSALPFFLFAVIWVVNPEYITPLIENTAGWIAIGAALLLMLGGILWMQKIVKIDV